jgi:hypothetical protein
MKINKRFNNKFFINKIIPILYVPIDVDLGLNKLLI